MDAKDTRIAELEKSNLTLRQENQLLRKELPEIKQRLGLDSKNSSKPPSSGGFKTYFEPVQKGVQEAWGAAWT